MARQEKVYALLSPTDGNTKRDGRLQLEEIQLVPHCSGRHFSSYTFWGSSLPRIRLYVLSGFFPMSGELNLQSH